jgi:hypothetical protein
MVIWAMPSSRLEVACNSSLPTLQNRRLQSSWLSILLRSRSSTCSDRGDQIYISTYHGFDQCLPNSEPPLIGDLTKIASSDQRAWGCQPLLAGDQPALLFNVRFLELQRKFASQLQSPSGRSQRCSLDLSHRESHHHQPTSQRRSNAVECEREPVQH